jgi:predicted nucleic acid-binding protein
MICFLDTSVILRFLFAEKDKLEEWGRIEYGVSSALLRVEALRTIDRERLRLRLSDKEVTRLIRGLNRLTDELELVDVQASVLDRASQPFPTTIRTLDAIHLATALLWQQRDGRELTFATHDEGQGQAAQALGLEVIGIVGE